MSDTPISEKANSSGLEFSDDGSYGFIYEEAKRRKCHTSPEILLEDKSDVDVENQPGVLTRKSKFVLL